MLPKGTYRARAIAAEFGFTQNGTEQVAVTFEVNEESEFNGDQITWFGFFTDATSERTVQALRACGWEGDDLENLAGFDANEVELVVGHEQYQGKTVAKVQWVNKPGNRVVLKHKMTDAQRAELSARMKGLVIATNAKGASAPPAPGAKAPAGKPSGRTGGATPPPGKGYPKDWDAKGL